MNTPATLLAALSLVGTTAAQDGFTPIPQSTLTTVGTLLPESSNAGAAFVSKAYSPNLVVSEATAVQVVFVWGGDGSRHSLGYFTYEEQLDGSVDLLSRGLILPDTSVTGAGPPLIGDTYTLRDELGEVRVFDPGTQIGFFLVADGWTEEPQIQAWDPATATIPSTDPALNATFGSGCFTSLDGLNPEHAAGASTKSRHLAMTWLPSDPELLGGSAPLLAGFEDEARTGVSDEDFNDLVFLITSVQPAALGSTQVPPFVLGDPDGDGVFGLDDAYPNDPERAYVQRSPSHGYHVIGFEDQYPSLGDADYNDVVLAYDIQIVSGPDGHVKDLLLTSHLVARGAGYDHCIGWHLPGLPADASGHVRTQRYFSDDELTEELLAPVDLRTVVEENGRRLPDLFPSTRDALPPGYSWGTFTNTQFDAVDRPAASARLLVTFDERVAPEVLGTLPYDLYVSIRHGDEEWDVHAPGYPGFQDRPGELPPEEGSESFLDDVGRPWLLELPTSWRFPMEHIRIWTAYPLFDAWAASGGSSYTDWYDQPASEDGLLGFELTAYVPPRDWDVDLPTP